MSQSFVLIIPGAWTITRIHAALESGNVPFSHIEGDNEIQAIHDNGPWLTISMIRDQRECEVDYQTNELLDESFRRQVGGSSFWYVNYNDIDLAKHALRNIASNVLVESDASWMDTDYGWVISLEEVAHNLAESSSWDWRHSRNS